MCINHWAVGHKPIVSVFGISEVGVHIKQIELMLIAIPMKITSEPRLKPSVLAL